MKYSDPYFEPDFRYDIKDVEKFKRTHEACLIVLNTYPKEISNSKTQIIFQTIFCIANSILFSCGLYNFWWFISISTWFFISILCTRYVMNKNKKLLKEAQYVKEKFDFILSYNSTPIRGEEYKGPRNPYQ